MPISGIRNSPYISQLNHTQTGGDRDGDSDDSVFAARNGSGGPFASAIGQALSQAGISATSGTTTNSSSSSSQNPQQALSAFMQNLFAALQSQGAQAGYFAAGGDRDGDHVGSGAAGATQHHGGGIGAMEAKLQGAGITGSVVNTRG